MGSPVSLQDTVLERREIQKSLMIFKDHLLHAQLNRELLSKLRHEKHTRGGSRNK